MSFNVAEAQKNASLPTRKRDEPIFFINLIMKPFHCQFTVSQIKNNIYNQSVRNIPVGMEFAVYTHI